MNRRMIAMLLIVAVLLAMTACKKNTNEAESTTEASIPGVVDLPVEIEVDWDNLPESTAATEAKPSSDETEATEAETAKDPTQSATTPTTDSSTESTTAPTTGPEQETTKPTEPAAKLTDYEWYNSLSGAEQKAFMETFDSIEAFFDWYNNAKAEYEAQKPGIDVGDGVIDLEDFAGGNG